MRARPFAALASLLVVSCGQNGDNSLSTPPTQQPTLSESEKLVVLASLPSPYNGADLENGRAAFARCRSCHTVTQGGPNMTGPNLYGIFGRTAGTHPGFNYSKAVKEAGFAWDARRLDSWLQGPRTFLPGNKMSFPGLPDATDRRDVIAWLKVETGYAVQTEPPVPEAAPAS